MARDYFDANSSFIDTVGYDSDTQTLGVKFLNGDTFNYHGVPIEVYQEFKSASSKGSYFHSNVKDVYAGNKV